VPSPATPVVWLIAELLTVVAVATAETPVCPVTVLNALALAMALSEPTLVVPAVRPLPLAALPPSSILMSRPSVEASVRTPALLVATTPMFAVLIAAATAVPCVAASVPAAIAPIVVP